MALKTNGFTGWIIAGATIITLMILGTNRLIGLGAVKQSIAQGSQINDDQELRLRQVEKAIVRIQFIADDVAYIKDKMK